MTDLQLPLLLAWLLVAVSGCGTSTPLVRIEHDERPPLSFGIAPFLERGALLENLQPLANYLSAGLGRPVELRIGPSYSDLDRMLEHHRLDLAWYRPHVEGQGVTGLSELCKPRPTGGRPHRGLIVTRRREGPATLATLANRRFAYVDRSSNSGFIYPNRLFVASGIDPSHYFSSIAFAGSHDRVAEQVISGAADAGAVSDILFGDQKRRDTLSRELIVLTETEPIPADPLVTPSNGDPTLRARLRELFLKMSDSPAGRETLARLSRSMGVEGFE